jgi:hypothetical protein
MKFIFQCFRRLEEGSSQTSKGLTVKHFLPSESSKELLIFLMLTAVVIFLKLREQDFQMKYTFPLVKV